MIQMHPHLASQIAAERHRDLLAHAHRQRTARRLTAPARASRQAERAGRRARRALRTATRLHPEAGH